MDSMNVRIRPMLPLCETSAAPAIVEFSEGSDFATTDLSDELYCSNLPFGEG
jgi:hypothetical protein